LRLLLDTSILLWWLADDPRLGTAARAAIASAEHIVYVSAASLWEIAVKQSAGKLVLPPEFQLVVQSAGFQDLPIDARHAAVVQTLPMVHQDPFDRMLVAQAQVEEMVLVTDDPRLARYDVHVLMA